MYFPDSYFEDEVREGFYVNGMMKRAWAEQMEVLCEVDRVCRKHGIKWFADCGTLLGAVRHGGYIPWDDDLDICMLRDDYVKFLRVTSELPEGYMVLTVDNTPDYDEMLARVVNSNKISEDAQWLTNHHQFPFPAGIDVFPLDYLLPDKEEESERGHLISVVSAVSNRVNDDNQNTEEMQKLVEDVESMCAVKFDRSRSLRWQLKQLLDKLFMLYTPGISDIETEPREVVLMTYWITDGNHKYKKEYFEHTIQLPFESITVNAPAMYDSVLRIEYGDYMKCVPGGGVHDYPFYKKLEEKLIEAADIYPYIYEFSAKDLEKKCNRGRKAVAHLDDFLKLAINAQETVAELLAEDELDKVCDTIRSYLNTAAIIANIAVAAYGTESDAVRLLCEYVRSMQLMAVSVQEENEEKVQDSYSRTDEILAELSDTVSALEKVREIVFITYNAKMWRYYDSIWSSFIKDPDTSVTVIPIPYYHRAMTGDFLKECYDMDGYPEYVTLTRPEDYNIAAHHPDMIFIQDPYDNVNYTTSIHPDFYSDNLKPMTDELIYVQSFETDDIEPDNQKAMFSAEYFVKAPAIVNADRVIVPSDKMRDTYIRILTEYAGEETGKIWEKKIESRKEWRPQAQASSEIIPVSWEKIILRGDGSRKKVMLYRISTSPVAEFGMKAVNKIKSALGVFYDRREDIALVFMPEACLWDVLGDFEETYAGFKELVEEYKNAGWGIYAEDKDINSVLPVCDAYYGDSGSLVQKFRRAGKPVMIEDINI